MLEKEPDPNDLRRVKLRVTSLGERKLESITGIQQQVNDQLFLPVSPENFEVLHTLSAELRNSAENALNLSGFLILEEKSA